MFFFGRHDAVIFGVFVLHFFFSLQFPLRLPPPPKKKINNLLKRRVTIGDAFAFSEKRFPNDGES